MSLKRFFFSLFVLLSTYNSYAMQSVDNSNVKVSYVPKLKNLCFKVAVLDVIYDKTDLKKIEKILPKDLFFEFQQKIKEWQICLLSRAIYYKNQEQIKELMVRGVNPNMMLTDDSLLTRLTNKSSFCFKKEDREILKIIFAAGANPYIKDKLWLKNAIKYSKMHGLEKEIISLLESYQFPTLKKIGIKNVGNQIILGKMKLEDAKKILPVDLHEELDAYIKEFQY